MQCRLSFVEVVGLANRQNLSKQKRHKTHLDLKTFRKTNFQTKVNSYLKDLEI